MSGFGACGVGTVPLRALISDSQNGLSKRSGDQGNELPVLRLADISGGAIDESAPRVIRLTEKERAKYELHRGDLLCIRVNGSKGLVGRMVPFTSAHAWAYCDHFIRLRPDPEKADYRYLAYFLNSAPVRRILELGMVSSAGQHTVSQGTVLELGVPLLPMDRQREIVAEIEKQFSRLDEAVANLQRVKANLKRYRAAVLKDAVEGHLVESQAEIARREGCSFESGEQLVRRVLEVRRQEGRTRSRAKEPATPNLAELPELPERWAWASIDQLAAAEANAITDGPFGSNLKSEHYVPAGPRVIRLQNIKDGGFADEYAHISADHFSKLRKHEVFAGDLVIASLGENPPRACVIPPSVGPAIVKADCIRFKPHPSVSAAYLNVALNCQPTRARVKDVLHGIGRPRLSLGEIRAIALPLPPAAEQHRIVAEVDRRLSIVHEVEAEVDANIRRARALRSAVLARVFEQDGATQ